MGIGGGGLVVGVSEAGGELAANHGSAAVSSSRGVKFPSSVLDERLTGNYFDSLNFRFWPT